MGSVADLLRSDRQSRWFFAALAQSSLGTGAGYVALLLIAFERSGSALGIGLVLGADLLPAVLFGPLFGAFADRFSRRTCMVAGDIARAGAFVGIALVDSFAATLALAALAGTGTALFTPASLAALPSLVGPPRLPAATALYGAVADLGYVLGPALAALVLLGGGPTDVMLINGATFALSALVLQGLTFGAAPEHEARVTGRLGGALVRDVRDGLRTAAAIPGVGRVLGLSAAALFFVGVFNVAELPFVTGELGAGEVGFSLLVGLFGIGFAVGSLAGSRGGPLDELKRRYLTGLALMGLGFLMSGMAPGVAVAAVTFTAAGFGNGLVLVYERLIVQATVPNELSGRVFGAKDSLTAAAFGLAFLIGGALLEVIDVRSAVVLAGAGGLAAWAVARVLLRTQWRPEPEPASAHGSAGGDRRAVRKQDADLVGGREHWLALLDDLG